MNGNNRIHQISSPLPSPYSLTVFQHYIYWTDLQTSAIERVANHDEYNRTVLRDNLEQVVDIKVYHASRQVGWNQCAVGNGGCSHLCLAVPNSGKGYQRRCACPTHYVLNEEDGTQCVRPTHFMLYNQKNHLIRFINTVNDVPDAYLPLHGVKNVKALAYDALENYVFWIDQRTHSIRKVHESGNKTNILVPNPNDQYAPYDLVADPYARVLFWSCSITNSINVTRFDGRPIGPIVGGSTDKPRALALYARKNFLFWVNFVSPPAIVRMSRDGLERKTIVNSSLEDPVALTVDATENALYWSDLGTKKIETCDFNGNHRRVLVSNPAIQPTSLAIFGAHLYWIDRELKSIERVEKSSGQQRSSVFSKLAVPTDLAVVDAMDTSPSSLACKVRAVPSVRDELAWQAGHVCVR